MKITDIQVVPVQAPGRTLVPVLVHTDAGITGVGEAGLQRRWQAIIGAVEHLKAWLIGQDPSRIEYLWQRMSRGGFYPADRLIGSAVSAIDIALWDIKGKALGAPVFELLGGRCRDHVEVFTNPPLPRDASAPEASIASAQEAIRRGDKYFRLGLTHAGERVNTRAAARALVAQLQAVRAAVGDQLELMVDLHTQLGPDEAIAFCRQVEPLDMFVVEDAIRSEHAHGYQRLCRHVRLPLAAGEQWSSKWEFRQAIEHEWVDFVRPDLCICGGITEGRKIAAMAETHLIKLLCHNPLGPICTAASLHLDLACENAGPQEVLFNPITVMPDVFQCDFKFDGTKLTPPSAPGLGVTFNVDRAAEYPPDMTEPPHFHRDDGSFTNY